MHYRSETCLRLKSEKASIDCNNLRSAPELKPCIRNNTNAAHTLDVQNTNSVRSCKQLSTDRHCHETMKKQQQQQQQSQLELRFSGQRQGTSALLTRNITSPASQTMPPPCIYMLSNMKQTSRDEEALVVDMQDHSSMQNMSFSTYTILTQFGYSEIKDTTASCAAHPDAPTVTCLLPQNRRETETPNASLR